MGDLPERLILFDGVCAVCDAGMRWILDHDVEGRFAYAPLQGETAARVRARHPEIPADLDSILYVRRTPAGEEVSWHSASLLAIAAELPRPWSWLRFLRIIPAFLRDPGYRAFAAVRYRIFGKLDHCRIPSPEEAARFLD